MEVSQKRQRGLRSYQTASSPLRCVQQRNYIVITMVHIILNRIISSVSMLAHDISMAIVIMTGACNSD